MSLILEVDSNALILKPSVHDGFLQAICLEEKDSCRLECKNSSGERIDFVLRGIVHLKANDFLQGNIIGELFLFNGENVPVARLEQLLDMGRPADVGYVGRLKEQCRIKNLRFFEIEPSYGCRLQVLCESVTCVSAGG